MAKKTSSAETLNYEQAMAELEALITNLENEPGGLEKSVSMFERGKTLLAQCQKLLDSAELKISQLEKDNSTSSLEE